MFRLIEVVHAYNATETLDKLGYIASSTQETLINTISRFLPIAIPLVIALALLWWVLRRFGVRR